MRDIQASISFRLFTSQGGNKSPHSSWKCFFCRFFLLSSASICFSRLCRTGTSLIRSPVGCSPCSLPPAAASAGRRRSPAARWLARSRSFYSRETPSCQMEQTTQSKSWLNKWRLNEMSIWKLLCLKTQTWTPVHAVWPRRRADRSSAASLSPECASCNNINKLWFTTGNT